VKTLRKTLGERHSPSLEPGLGLTPLPRPLRAERAHRAIARSDRFRQPDTATECAFTRAHAGSMMQINFAREFAE
jgi:hypothetical protein